MPKLIIPVAGATLSDAAKLEFQRGNTEISLIQSNTAAPITVYTKSVFLTGENGFVNYTFRLRFCPEAKGKRIRFAFKGSTTEDLKFDLCYVSLPAASGNPWDYDGNQVKVTFSGADGGTVPANGTLTSDWATITLDPAKDVILGMDISSDGTKDTIIRDNWSTGSSPLYAMGFQGFYKSNTDAAATATPAGLTAATPSVIYLISLVEIAGFDTTSPTATLLDVDSGATGTVWDMSTISTAQNLLSEAGTVNYKYAYGDTAGPTNWNAAWLSLANLKAEADPTGRYFKIQAQFVSTGAQDASLQDMSITATLAAGGGSIWGGIR